MLINQNMSIITLNRSIADKLYKKNNINDNLVEDELGLFIEKTRVVYLVYFFFYITTDNIKTVISFVYGPAEARLRVRDIHAMLKTYWCPSAVFCSLARLLCR